MIVNADNWKDFWSHECEEGGEIVGCDSYGELIIDNEGELEKVSECSVEVVCGSCNGSGEGQWDGSRCTECGGGGVL